MGIGRWLTSPQPGHPPASPHFDVAALADVFVLYLDEEQLAQLAPDSRTELPPSDFMSAFPAEIGVSIGFWIPRTDRGGRRIH